jgi:hypothetical protein
MTEIPAVVQRFAFPVLLIVGRLLGNYGKYADAPEPVSPTGLDRPLRSLSRTPAGAATIVRVDGANRLFPVFRASLLPRRRARVAAWRFDVVGQRSRWCSLLMASASLYASKA